MCMVSKTNFFNVYMHIVHPKLRGGQIWLTVFSSSGTGFLTFYDVDALPVRGVLAGIVRRGEGTSVCVFCPTSTLHRLRF